MGCYFSTDSDGIWLSKPLHSKEYTRLACEWCEGAMIKSRALQMSTCGLALCSFRREPLERSKAQAHHEQTGAAGSKVVADSGCDKDACCESWRRVRRYLSLSCYKQTDKPTDRQTDKQTIKHSNTFATCVPANICASYTVFICIYTIYDSKANITNCACTSVYILYHSCVSFFLSLYLYLHNISV